MTTDTFETALVAAVPRRQLRLVDSIAAFATRYYPAFVIALWVFVPELRRVIDWQIGFNSVSIVSFLPILSLIPLAFLYVRRRQRLSGILRVTVVTMVAVLIYALYIAWASSNLVPGLFGLTQFGLPIGFALWFLKGDLSDFDRDFDRFCTSLLWIVTVSALYGLFQYASPPAWDAVWVANSGLNSIGEAVPFGLRIFGTLNAPGPFADVLFFTILLNLRFVQQGQLWRIALLLPIFAAFALTLVRSDWLALVLGLFVYGILTPKRTQFLGATAALAVVAFAVAMNLDTIFGSTSGANQGLAQRFQTFGNLDSDDSAEARQELLASSWNQINSSPLGAGLGATGTAAKLSSAQETLDIDNGYIARLLEFGYFGFFGYLVVILVPVVYGVRALGSARREGDIGRQNLIATCLSLQVSLLGVEVSSDHHLGFSGIMFWMSVVAVFAISTLLGKAPASVAKERSNSRMALV